VGDCQNHWTAPPPLLGTILNTRHRRIPRVSEIAALLGIAVASGIHAGDTGSPKLLPGTMRIVLAIEGLFYLVMAAARIWWLVYFTLRTVKSYFVPDFAISTTNPRTYPRDLQQLFRNKSTEADVLPACRLRSTCSPKCFYSSPSLVRNSLSFIFRRPSPATFSRAWRSICCMRDLRWQQG
jgi:hypothetical protein